MKSTKWQSLERLNSLKNDDWKNEWEKPQLKNSGGMGGKGCSPSPTKDGVVGVGGAEG